MVPRRAYETIGPFDEIFEAGWEDEDYCIRASIAGFRLGIDTSSYIYHKGGQTVSKAPHNPKNKEHFKKKWGIDLIPSATMPGFSMITAIAQKMNDLGVTIGGQVVTMGMVNKTKV
jgi:hypothetical protein